MIAIKTDGQIKITKGKGYVIEKLPYGTIIYKPKRSKNENIRKKNTV